MNKSNNNTLIFVILGLILVGLIFFNTDRGTGRVQKTISSPSPGWTCIEGWYCVDSNTKAYRTVSCQTKSITDCGTNEVCQNGGCIPQMNQTHTECISNACIQVQGPGINQCLTTNDCLPQNTCSDTDGGQNHLIQGTVSGILNGIPYSYTDYCVTQYSNNLEEYYCVQNSAGGIGYPYVDCAYQYPGTICQNGACVSPPQNLTGTAYFTSSPSGAFVYSSITQFWGITPFTKEFQPGTYTAKANKPPFYPSYVYNTFTINSGQQTNVNFVLNQTYHSGCLFNSSVNNYTCFLIAGPGSTTCQPIGSGCNP